MVDIAIPGYGPVTGADVSNVLTSLKIHGARMHVGMHGWYIGHLTLLSILDYARVGLGHEAIQLLAAQLMQLTRLEYLSLHKVCTGEDGAQDLALCLA